MARRLFQFISAAARTEEAPAPQSEPVAAQVFRPVTPVAPTDSLSRVVHLLRQQQVTALPVVMGGYLRGWITADRVAEHYQMHGEAARHTLVGVIAEAPPVACGSGTSMRELEAIFRDSGQALLPVVSLEELYLGCVTQADVLAALTGYLAPPRLGGMATPLGVYLTTGLVSGGVGSLGLILSGMMMAFLLWVAQTIAILGTGWGYHLTRSLFLLDLSKMLAEQALDGQMAPERVLVLFILSTLVLMGIFLGLLRIAPLMTGYHAAEHQTVNAIEAGEPLTPEAVARQSRAHPRCGTNLWGIMLLSYLGLALLAIALTLHPVRHNLPLVAPLALFTVFFIVVMWRRFGTWIQLHFTTRRASPRDLASGLRAGEEVLRRHRALGATTVRPLQRFLRMGLLQVALGVVVMGLLLQLLAVPLDGLWRSLVK